MFSTVLLNWKRPENVKRIVQHLRECGCDDIIVWDNRPAGKLTLDLQVKLIRSEDLGLYTRFAAGCLAKHRTVLIQDDDLILEPSALWHLIAAFKSTPDILHGVFGRRPKEDGGYAKAVDKRDAEVEMALTRVLVANRSLFGAFFEDLHFFEDIQANSRPYGNGEDIILNYVAMRRSGKLNRVHKIVPKELPAPHAIHGREPSHVAHRTRLLKRCQEYLNA